MAQMVKIYSASQINISYSSLPKRKPWIGLPHEKDQGIYFSTSVHFRSLMTTFRWFLNTFPENRSFRHEREHHLQDGEEEARLSKPHIITRLPISNSSTDHSFSRMTVFQQFHGIHF